MNLSDQVVRQGVRRLRALLPKARAEVQRGEGSFEIASSVFAAQRPWLRQDNFEALVVYQTTLGGWHVDLRLKHVPPGVANAIGTPVQSPCRTREEAEQFAFRLLWLALTIEAANQTAPQPPRTAAFLLYESDIRLPAHIFNKLLDAYPEAARGYGSEDAALERIERMLSELFPEGYTHDRMQALPPEKRAEVFAVCTGATLSGVFRYPPPPHLPPSSGPYVTKDEL